MDDDDTWDYIIVMPLRRKHNLCAQTCRPHRDTNYMYLISKTWYTFKVVEFGDREGRDIALCSKERRVV